MVLGMTGGAWTAPYFDMEVQECPYAVVSHWATRGACTTSLSHMGAEWAGVSRASWAVPCTVSGAGTLRDVPGVFAPLTRRL